MLIDNLHWQQPWWLVMAIAPWLIYKLRDTANGSARLARFIERSLWPKILSGSINDLQQPRRQWPFVAAWLLASIALAGPFIAAEEQQLRSTSAANIAVVIDISPSMNVKDVDNRSRLDYSKQLLDDWLQRLTHHRVALISFSANAYTVLPLTTDKESLRMFLDALDPSLATVSGSNLSRALQLANDALSAPRVGQTKTSPGMVLLISDGEIHDRSALNDARELLQNGHTLYALGVGSEQGGPVPVARGRLIRHAGKLVNSQRQRGTLMALAQAAGGQYQDLSPEAEAGVLKAIEALQTDTETEIMNARIEKPLFPWLLTLALGLFLWAGLRRPESLAIVLLAPLLFQATDTEAAPWEEARALQLIENNNNEAAIKIYSNLYNFNGAIGQGVAAYQMGDWPAALAAFDMATARAENTAQQSQAAYNRGNTLTQLGRLKEAVSAFERALELQPTHLNAAKNLRLVQRHLQQWGGESQREQSPLDRPGMAALQDQNKTGTGPGDSLLRLTDDQGQNGNEGNQSSPALQQSLKQWSRLGDSGEAQAPLRAWQQFQTLQEDNQAMLKHRFEIEDSQVQGLVEDKPW